MQSEEFDALRIFRDALDTDPGERLDFIVNRCNGDAQLRGRVEALLGSVASDELAAISTDASDAPMEAVAADSLIGTRLGAFRILDRIGRGGMGIVYRAEREGSDFSQHVAIKLIRRGFDFDDVQARFLRERRILSQLSHPNLARFIDGGVAADGRPWFALEYVQGSIITEWCDSRQHSVRERVRLFLSVCAAVQYAHTQLIVHRDIKPGNVLVDDAGNIRLLDFGIARLLSGDGDPTSELPTASGHIAFTPEFASPEQIRGESAGVSCDVFALGVLLYLLTTGALPYDFDSATPTAARLRDFEKPPTALTQAIFAKTGKTSSDVLLEQRSTTLRQFRNAVRGDLTRIIETALASEPERRYPSVAAFAEDLKRWLQGDPVRVSGNRFGYRLGKFVRRNATAVALSLLLVIALVSSTVWALQSAMSERQQRAVATREAERNLQIKDQLIELFLQPEDANFQRGGKSAIQFLDQATERLQKLPTDSSIRGELGGVLMGIYGNLGEWDRASALGEALLGEAPLSREKIGDADLRLVTVWAQANWAIGNSKDVLAPLESAIAQARDTHSKVYLDALMTLSSVYISEGRFAAAVSTSTQALTLVGVDHAKRPELINIRMALAAAYVGNRQASLGREQTERALVEVGPEDSGLHILLDTMAGLRRALFGEFASAQTLFDDGANQWKRLGLNYGRHFHLASSASNAFDLGDLERARILLNEMRDSAGSSNGESRPSTVAEIAWLSGELELHQDHHAKAAAYFSSAADWSQRGNEQNPRLAAYFFALQAVSLSRDGKPGEARQALESAQKASKSNERADFASALVLAAQAVLLSFEGRPSTALDTFDRALAELEAGRKNPAVLEEQLKENRDALRIRVWKIEAKIKADQLEAAAADAREARRLGMQALGPQHPFMHELDELEPVLPPEPPKPAIHS